MHLRLGIAAFIVATAVSVSSLSLDLVPVRLKIGDAEKIPALTMSPSSEPSHQLACSSHVKPQPIKFAQLDSELAATAELVVLHVHRQCQQYSDRRRGVQQRSCRSFSSLSDPNRFRHDNNYPDNYSSKLDDDDNGERDEHSNDNGNNQGTTGANRITLIALPHRNLLSWRPSRRFTVLAPSAPTSAPVAPTAQAPAVPAAADAVSDAAARMGDMQALFSSAFALAMANGSNATANGKRAHDDTGGDDGRHVRPRPSNVEPLAGPSSGVPEAPAAPSAPRRPPTDPSREFVFGPVRWKSNINAEARTIIAEGMESRPNMRGFSTRRGPDNEHIIGSFDTAGATSWFIETWMSQRSGRWSSVVALPNA
ncbi:hypothetical protein C8R47DRAFT_1243193 [Mycena vitilis]|nr:hypothetical protein C8R47DRAFT_1243193 [Mycena vitilis]